MHSISLPITDLNSAIILFAFTNIRCESDFKTVRVGLKIEIHEIHQNLRNPMSIFSETCLNQQRQPPTLCQRTWTVDEIKVASSRLNLAFQSNAPY